MKRTDTISYVGNGAKTTTAGVAAGCTEKVTPGTCTGGTKNIACNASYYKTTSDTCVSCATGQYSTQGMNTCATCTGLPANAYYTSNGTTQSGCAWECNTGYHKNAAGTACEPDCSTSKTCPTGYTGTYNECEAGDINTKCSVSCSIPCTTTGATCPEHATSCTYDTTSTYTYTKYYPDTCNEAAKICPLQTVTACETGWEVSPDKQSCVQVNIICAAGTYLPMGQLVCATCPAGAYCPGNETFHFNAVMDQGKNGCTAGHYCPVGSASQTTCPTNYPNSDAGADAITNCYSNTKKRPWDGEYEYCKRPENCSGISCYGHPLPDCDYVAYANTDGTADGVVKDGCATNNETVHQTIDHIIGAEPGYYIDEETQTCPVCPDGQTCAGGTEPPATCPAGKICVGGIDTECPAGSYCPTGTTEPTECPAGSYCPTGSTEPVECPTGSYCLAGSTEPTSCPDGSDGSDEPRDNVTNCYQSCDLTTDDIAFSISVEAIIAQVYANDQGQYPICEYKLVCKTGFMDTIDKETNLPMCQDMRRKVVLDDQNPTTPAGIKTVYLMTGLGWYSDFDMTTQIEGIGILPTKNGYDFAGYYMEENGLGAQIIDDSGEFVTLAMTGTTAKIYAYWVPGTTTCPAGQYYADGVGCTRCLDDHYCLGGDFKTEGGNQGLNACTELGDGRWTVTINASKPTDCLVNCKIETVVGGIAKPVNAFESYPNECTYTGTSDTGNPCDIIDGVCVETYCNADYELIGGVCTPCDREFAMEYMPNANCKITNCIAGYHPNTGGLACEPDEIECDAPNAISGRRVWDNKKQAYSTCVATECESGFHIASGACVTDEQSCVVEHGIGVREWDTVANAWGKCVATYCDPGYTDIASESDEPNAPCGRCKNYFSVLGEPAASSYVRGCELASCLYSGEKYILDGNECRPICETASDETGTKKWNPTTKKCERVCKPGYAMW